ncbi:MAG: hypothetical protein PHP32_02100 [Candidatus Izemoplasmatales bacterium]|nr:hypothetical protein [Candidatus Izemoplasmatales bacterium]
MTILDYIVDFLTNLIGGIDFETFLIIFGVTILLFLLIRELVTWYWKMNKIVRLQSEQIRLLQDILSEMKKDYR